MQETGGKHDRTKNLAVVGLITFFLLASAGVAFAQESKIIVSPNRFVVLDDPNTGTKASGFFDPTDVRGGSWGSNYWSGESTTIRAAAQVLNSNGQPQSGITVAFTLKNPGNTVKNTAQSTTDPKGIAYYSFNLNEQKYWGYWIIEANATVSGVNIVNKTSFALNWWGCGQCHTNQNPGSWGTYTPKSYYAMGYNFHRNQTISKHTEAMSDGTCIICHTMYNGTSVNWRFTDNTPNINPDNEYSPDWHNGKRKCQDCHEGSNRTTTPQGKNPEIAGCYDTAGCHAKKNNNLSSMLSTTGYVVGGSYRTNYSFIPNNAVKAHTGPSVPCITCHNAGHNITKPYNTTSTSNTFTEYQQCTVCHQTYSRHNNNISCTVCHSQDVHAIKVFSQSASYVTGITNPARGNCTNCHQNATFQDRLKAQPKAGSYTGRNPPQIPTPLNHSIDPYSGALWNGSQPAYWDNKSQLSACNYCHGTAVLHNDSALGNINKIKGTNNLNQSLIGSSWCANCHYKNAPDYAGDNLSPQPPEVLNLNGLVPATARDGTTFYNHSDALSTSSDDATCKACHNNNLAAGATSLDMSHNVATGSSGGRDCVSCHDKGKSLEKVDVSKMNQTDSIHNILNSNAVIVTPGLNPDNKRCWSCHTGSSLGADNVVNEAELPASGHPSGYNVPAKCTQCHIQGNFSALVVSEHFSGSTEIKTRFYANTNDSCVNCHNKSEMLLLNSDPNGPKSIYASVSHYGSNKTNAAPYISGGSANCTYCHQNPASGFTTEMNDAAGNSSISNHTQIGTNPACINCHGSGRIHFSSLTKPSAGSSLCANCHINNKHNDTVECSQCHMQSNRNIHSIQYLQPDGTYKINSQVNKSTSVKCTNCHQGAGVSGITGAPKVPEPLNHSEDSSAGQKWGNYWDNTSAITACYYCHQNQIHKNYTDLLGNVSTIRGSNILNNPDLKNSTWCANCHYAGEQGYRGNLLSNPPPEITNSSLVSSDGTLFFNHSGLSNFNDSNCKACHGLVLSGYSETSLNFSHSVSVGGGGDNCISCHGTNYIGASPSVTQTFVNISAFNESIHQDINNTQPATLDNLDCWSCHYNKDMDRLNVKKCGDCHRKPSQWHGNANITTNLSELW